MPLLSAVGVAALVVFVELGNRGTDGNGSPAAAAPSQPTQGVVPWIDTPGVAHVEAPITPEPVPSYRPCAHGDLALRLDQRVDGASGRYLSLVHVTNTSATACTVDGPPALSIAGSSGPRSVKASIWRVRNFSNPAGILPGHAAQAELWTPTECEGDPSSGSLSTELWVSVPDAGQYAAGTVQLSFDCIDVSVTDFRRAEDYPNPAPQGLSALQVRVDSPASVRPGAPLDFTVQLTNPTGEDVSLENCPSYRLFLATGEGAFADRLFRLNCAGTTGAIEAGASVTFAMRLNVPPDMGPAPIAKFFWELQVEGRPSGGAKVAVVAG